MRKDWFFAVLLAVGFSFQVISFIQHHSNTYDEVAYIGAGYHYVETGRLELDILEHPPLVKYLIGISLKVLRISFPGGDANFVIPTDAYRFGHDLIYKNNGSFERILLFARLPSFFLSLALAIFVWFLALRWYGAMGAQVSLLCFSFEPNLIAHAGLATMDMALTCFLFAAFVFFVLWLEEKKVWQVVMAGILAGCAVSSKIPGLIFFLWLPILYLMAVMGKKKNFQKDFKLIVLLGLISIVVVILVYQGRYLSSFLSMFNNRWSETLSLSPANVPPNYFHGHFFKGTMPFYYLAVFLIKTPLGFLLLFFFSLIFAFKERNAKLLLVPILTYFVFCSFSSKQQGLRYLLPIYPFLCVMVGSLIPHVKRQGKWVIAGALGVFLVESVSVYPHYLAFFNQSIGGPERGSEWLLEANGDWGQDLPALKTFLEREKNPAVILAYFGTASARAYIGDHQNLLDADTAPTNPMNPPREFLVVSATLLRGLFLENPDLFSWLREKEPLEKLGYTLFVYDVTRDEETHLKLSDFYEKAGKPLHAKHEWDRAHALP